MSGGFSAIPSRKPPGWHKELVLQTDRHPAHCPFAGARRHLLVLKALGEGESPPRAIYPPPDAAKSTSERFCRWKSRTASFPTTPSHTPGIYFYFPRAEIHLSGSPTFDTLSDGDCTWCRAPLRIADANKFYLLLLLRLTQFTSPWPQLADLSAWTGRKLPRLVCRTTGARQQQREAACAHGGWGEGCMHTNDRLNLLIFITTWEFFKTRRVGF